MKLQLDTTKFDDREEVAALLLLASKQLNVSANYAGDDETSYNLFRAAGLLRELAVISNQVPPAPAPAPEARKPLAEEQAESGYRIIGLRRIAAQVILNALADLQRPKARRSAKAWLTSEQCTGLLQALGLNPDRLPAVIERLEVRQ